MDFKHTLLRTALESFLSEDIGYGDITTEALVDPTTRGEGIVVCKADAVIAGIDEALLMLELAGCEGIASVRDGERIRSGSKVLTATGPARGLLSVERTLLNLLSHMSGVATATADLIDVARKESKGRTRVACTRKTLPGLRYFQKRAVEIGGGDTHRLRLDDAVLIKDNHLSLVGSLAECVRKSKSVASFTKKIEVEATSPNQAVEAAKAGADIVLLDNMTPNEVKESLRAIEANGLRDRIIVEASGGITRENIASYAKTLVDVVSVGSITHSAQAIDISMEIHASKKGK